MKRGDILRDERLKHLKALEKLGIDPYPATTDRSALIADAKTELGQEVTVVGRITALRSHGKVTFFDLQDESGQVQVYARADELPDLYPVIDLLDAGDFFQSTGSVIETKSGELSVHLKSGKLLAKALRPLPDDWQGLKDVEERYRKRYLDLLLNPETKELFRLRGKIFTRIRDFMNRAGFAEVETPTLQPLYGGASAKPFLTYYHAYDTHVFLKIAPELYLKRLLIGGYEKVYELSRNFRNEGADPTHNPEFMELEFYASFWDEERLMDFTEELVVSVVQETLGKPEIEVGQERIEIKRPFDRITFEALTKGTLSDQDFKMAVKEIRRPTFVLQTPRYLVPLAKGLNKEVARSFQFVLAGLELAKAFAELNDPLDQRAQFEAQQKGRQAGDQEAQPLDEDFLEALEYGMPPAAGFGMGLERFVALLANQETLRQTMYFPFMKPKHPIDVTPWLNGGKQSKVPRQKRKRT